MSKRHMFLRKLGLCPNCLISKNIIEKMEEEEINPEVINTKEEQETLQQMSDNISTVEDLNNSKQLQKDVYGEVVEEIEKSKA